MSTDTLQNRFTTNGKSNASVIANSRDFFNFLKKSEKPKHDSGTYDLLKSAYTMLEKAEKDLIAKTARIKNLEELLTTDELTSLTNRRGFYKHFVRELERTNRGENEGGLIIMIDLDHFKAVNDTFGHLAGDKALKIVGQFLKDFMRSYDIAARLGGDEFIVLMPNTNSTKAMERAKLLEQSLNAISFSFNGAKINIHGSIGIREYAEGDSIETIIGDADQGMYEKKEARKLNS
ncbi:MAG: GGDEF domain-containing protein [Alphaproteobacteria bacterium]